jgi:hypothetical protein
VVKSSRSLIPIALLFLVMAASSSVVIWGNVSSAAKIAFFCYGFGSGVATGGALASWRAARG